MSDDVVEQFSGAIADVGWFLHDRTTDEWRWDDGMFRIHGYAPGEVRPTGELMLRHKHPDDRDVVLAARALAYDRARPVSCSHRIITVTGELRSVVTVARGEPGPDGAPGYLHGFVTDLTDSRVSDTLSVAADAVSAAPQSRAVIEQAKGALMMTYGIDAEAAFNVLRRHSQHRNMRLAEVAGLFVSSFTDHHWVAQLRPVLGDVLDQYLSGTGPRRARGTAPTGGMAPAGRPRLTHGDDASGTSTG